MLHLTNSETFRSRMKEWIEDAWLNLSEKEVEELRYNKQELTKYGREKLRTLIKLAQEHFTDAL